jgi:phenylacetic acid degradation operon negative regulatory protein
VDEQLRRRSVGAPAARSLLLTVLGEYLLPRQEPVWQETLVNALTTLGYSSQAARQALARSVREGWLVTERHGRRARIGLSESTADLLSSGARRIYSFGDSWQWDGRWLLLVVRVPEQRREVRHQLRTRFAWAGVGSLGGGVWLTAHVEREAELVAAIQEEPAAEATSFVATVGSLGSPEALAAAGWDLDAVRDHYAEFIADFQSVRPASPQSCFRLQTLLVHAWRKFPFLDPDLPSELLPASWPRQRARELFAARHESWTSAARAYFEALETGRSAPAARAA